MKEEIKPNHPKKAAGLPYVEREIEEKVLHWLDAREIIAIRGPRQSGKTTLLNHISEVLLSKGIGKENIHFITMEDDEERIRFETAPNEVISYLAGNSGSRHYIFIDEIQYVKNAGKILKLLYDSHENIKFIITGSSALDLGDISSYLVGRLLFFELFPLSFSEFLRIKDQPLADIHDELSIAAYSLLSGKGGMLKNTAYLDKLNRHLDEYVTYGGYPRVCLASEAEDKKFLLKNLVQTYLEKDIVKLYGARNSDSFMALLKYLASSSGNLINYEAMGRAISVNYAELKSMLSMLESTYVIKRVSPFHRNAVTELKKNPKIYFIDLGLRNYLLQRFEFDNSEKGRLYEAHLFNSLRNFSPYFWRTAAKAEVDFILPENNFPLEVKSTSIAVSRSLRSFISTYVPKKAFLLSREMLSYEKMGETEVHSFPFAYL